MARGEVNQCDDASVTPTTIDINNRPVFFEASMWPHSGNAGELGNKWQSKTSSSLEVPQDTHKSTSHSRSSNDETSYGGKKNHHGGGDSKGEESRVCAHKDLIGAAFVSKQCEGK